MYIHTATIGCQILQSIFSKLIQRGEVQNVADYVVKLSEDKRFLDAFFRMILQDNSIDELKVVNKIVGEALVLKLNKEMKKNLSFWNSFMVIDKNLVIAVCHTNPDILTAVINFIIYFGKSLELEVMEDSCQWKVGEAYGTGDMSFESLVILVKCLLESRGRAGEQMRKTLQELKHRPGCSVWVEVERQCFLPVLAKYSL